MEAVGDAVDDDVRGVALGIATLFFLVGGGVGSAVVGGLGDVLGMAPALLLLAVLPLVGLAALRAPAPPVAAPSPPTTVRVPRRLPRVVSHVTLGIGNRWPRCLVLLGVSAPTLPRNHDRRTTTRRTAASGSPPPRSPAAPWPRCRVRSSPRGPVRRAPHRRRRGQRDRHGRRSDVHLVAAAYQRRREAHRRRVRQPRPGHRDALPRTSPERRRRAVPTPDARPRDPDEPDAGRADEAPDGRWDLPGARSRSPALAVMVAGLGGITAVEAVTGKPSPPSPARTTARAPPWATSSGGRTPRSRRPRADEGPPRTPTSTPARGAPARSRAEEPERRCPRAPDSRTRTPAEPDPPVGPDGGPDPPPAETEPAPDGRRRPALTDAELDPDGLLGQVPGPAGMDFARPRLRPIS